MGARHQRGGDTWRVAAIAADAEAAQRLTAVLGDACGTVSAFELASDGWRVEGFTTTVPPLALLEAMLAVAWTGRADAVPALACERVPPRDWLAASAASFPPMRVGHYFIHGSHHRGGVPAGRIGLRMDAATAFGTGEHATTRGCLLALDALARRRRRRHVLDMGTGTGILAIAAAKTWRRPVEARDIDHEAVRVAGVNVARNGVGPLVIARRSDGYLARGIIGRRFDLVFANILARPLMRMAPRLARALAPGGIAVLSGLLARQERAVLATHRAQRLVLRRRIAHDGWCTLMMAKGLEVE
ncbi:MAG TPA: 50S ribosomal protein L11 methyltransferase [Stellaceae bacterium]|nr:50S ribosomal protein L11 methyltransferase [Stellaceae bacterium]